MLSLIAPAVISGLATGAIYALVALGLTMIYGVLHIINFAHGSLLMLALYAVFFANTLLGVDPYVAMPFLMAVFFVFGYLLQRGVINTFSHGKDSNTLLVTLALAIVIDNLALYFWTSNTRTIDVPYAFNMVEIAGAYLPLPKLIAFVASLLLVGLVWLFMMRTRIGQAIRAVAKEKRGAQLMGIDVNHTYAVCFGIGTACVAAAACLLMPTFYVTPQVGYSFVLVAFTTVVLGGMGSYMGALVAGLFLGVVEALSGLFLGETLGQIGIYACFILTLLFRPSGLFGRKGA
ncbi:branched-chain amino acid ABC transporter permease [Pusillimonas noertemannii]|uniref:Amino acid/amide ABC transporter membrane protein 1 (HAAT family) n=1 Tax=Pusillimonas noertemannii TaxID=305977 RepID=A0A2U1CN16_9BURK|nr:branched-chain amino acid ABC transporter permease [Pusillimonas noertemannii]NYT68578.1 branched-chain amino acid ABC transporter permease [Pusillimonas noertemannii]PVY62405.1 amino acid/amide ABC transporter membrane protein 1 (HAAT family) [Pusillimonas noertemannii]TFL10632.1 branched-chain amino acid ABC transporter permease [Pusillimonas noertemannii]